MWCGHITETVLGCDGFSTPCFYKLLCADSLVCNTWKQEFCGNQTSLLEVGKAAQADDWILESLVFNHSSRSPAQQKALSMSKRAKQSADYDMLLSRTNDKVDMNSDSLSGLDASVKGKCDR
jgi:hypothetical protein